MAAAIALQYIFAPQEALDGLGCYPQNLVANLVPPIIVNLFKVIQG